ncbi:MAG TPA: tRNA epoxyqueuosine(34) reductase QueG [Stellaceae bacterium]|jgi:epoxyqueuosine reductase|nr:tRNA epoxyqueuosine(34) reductase QueG [Stellaceae bacterium]
MATSPESAFGPRASRPQKAAGPSTDAQESAVQNTAEIREAIRNEALALGFDAVGFARAHLAEEARDNLAEYLRRGYHGDMGWLAAKAPRRGDPQVLWPDAKTIVVFGLAYTPEDDPMTVVSQPDRGAISVYARGRDYHDTVKKRLKALGRWIAGRWPGELKVFVDTAPVMEKPLAQQAGLGWQGKHTNLVSRDFGSWLFLGEIYLSRELEPDVPEADHCGSCRRCLDACPTDAFPAPYRLDARRCISYLTIEHQGPIPHEFRAAIGNRIYGCDDCLAACPWNKFADAAKEPDFLPRAALTAPKLAELARLDDAGFRALFAGAAVKRLGRDRFLRNVLIAIGNGPPSDPELIDAAERCLDDASSLVRATAAWACARLAPGGDIWRRIRHDPDPLMQAECAEMSKAI